MHESVMTWVDRIVQQHQLNEPRTKVLEVGAYDENGTIRDLFDKTEYIATDMREGPGVDRVVNAHHLDAYFGEDEFDVVVCCEMLEHDDKFWVTLWNISHVLKKGGAFLLTTRGNGFPEHAFPNDYFRFMPASAPLLMNAAECGTIEAVPDPQQPGIFVVGRRL